MWGAVIITGFLALVAIAGGIEGLAVFSRIHSLAVRLGLVYTVVFIIKKHIIPRLKTIVMTRKQDCHSSIHSSQAVPKSKKIITAVLFHIVLHIISIHLAVAYTIFHIIQHRQWAKSLIAS